MLDVVMLLEGELDMAVEDLELFTQAWAEEPNVIGKALAEGIAQSIDGVDTEHVHVVNLAFSPKRLLRRLELARRALAGTSGHVFVDYAIELPAARAAAFRVGQASVAAGLKDSGAQAISSALAKYGESLGLDWNVSITSVASSTLRETMIPRQRSPFAATTTTTTPITITITTITTSATKTTTLTSKHDTSAAMPLAELDVKNLGSGGDASSAASANIILIVSLAVPCCLLTFAFYCIATCSRGRRRRMKSGDDGQVADRSQGESDNDVAVATCEDRAVVYCDDEESEPVSPRTICQQVVRELWPPAASATDEAEDEDATQPVAIDIYFYVGEAESTTSEGSVASSARDTKAAQGTHHSSLEKLDVVKESCAGRPEQLEKPLAAPTPGGQPLAEAVVVHDVPAPGVALAAPATANQPSHFRQTLDVGAVVNNLVSTWEHDELAFTGRTAGEQATSLLYLLGQAPANRACADEFVWGPPFVSRAPRPLPPPRGATIGRAARPRDASAQTGRPSIAGSVKAQEGADGSESAIGPTSALMGLASSTEPIARGGASASRAAVALPVAGAAVSGWKATAEVRASEVADQDSEAPSPRLRAAVAPSASHRLAGLTGFKLQAVEEPSKFVRLDAMDAHVAHALMLAQAA